MTPAMGCRSLSYHHSEEGLDTSAVFLQVSYSKNEIPEKNRVDYYPFGLQHTNSYTRITNLKNNFLFNAGSELNETTQNYMTPFRRYDPAIGRFNAVDAFVHLIPNINPYQFAFNDPISFNDPTGLSPEGDSYHLPIFAERNTERSNNSRLLNNIGRPSQINWSNPYYQYQGPESSSFSSFYGQAMRSEHGGTWNSTGESTLFSSSTEAVHFATRNYRWEKYSYVDYSTENIGEFGGTGATVVIGSKLVKQPGDKNIQQADFFGPIGRGFSQLGDLYGDLFRDLDGEFGVLNLAAAQTAIFAGAATIAAENSRPLYAGPRAWVGTTRGATTFANRLSAVGIGLSLIDMVNNGINTSNTLDVTFGIIGYMGPIGASVAGAYFVSNLITVGATGQSIGEHVDSYVWVPTGVGVAVPVAKLK